MKIPKMLDDYLEETEQYADDMTDAELYEESAWVLSQYKAGDFYNDQYTVRDVSALKAFITRINKRMVPK